MTNSPFVAPKPPSSSATVLDSGRGGGMKIVDIRATPVTIPLEAPLRHANGCHWGRFVRTIVEIETDEGLIGLGELGGGGESAVSAVNALKPYLIGRDPVRLEELRFVIANPTASLYNNRTQILAAVEFACLDLLGQKWGVPVSDILGGRVRDPPLLLLVACTLVPERQFVEQTLGHRAAVRPAEQVILLEQPQVPSDGGCRHAQSPA